MTTNKPAFRTPDEVEVVYYEAFKNCDLEVMASLWSEEDAICIHPGSGVINGHQAIMRSWSNIFVGSTAPDLEYAVVKRTLNDNLAVHLVAETIGMEEQKAVVLATNVYQQFEHGWLMVEHHASLMQSHPHGQTLQ